MQLLDFYRSRFGQAVKRQGNGWNGPCPICGGTAGKSDRFMVWPDRAESLGELCAKNHIVGIWSCRQCGESGDTIAYLTKCEGLSFKDALAELGIEGQKTPYKRKAAPVSEVASPAWEPKAYDFPCQLWLDQAEKLVCKAEKAIQDNAPALKWLAARGITDEAVKKYRLGYIKSENDKYQGCFRPRASFGLEAKLDQNGKKHDKLFIPRGIVIPTMGPQGEIINIRIRRHREDLKNNAPKYLELAGSCHGPMLLPSSLAKQLAPYFITEAELDAILIHHTSCGVIGAIAVRTNRGKPDQRCHAALKEAVRISIALDYDEAGSAGCDFWAKTYASAQRWPTPQGKDPGDAFALGVNIREWLEASLPASISLPEAATNSGTIAQNEQEFQATPENGQKDTTCPGSSTWEGGASPDKEIDKGISENRTRIEARAMSSQGFGPKDEPSVWASEEDFSDEELAALKKALPCGMNLTEVYLEVALIWLLWRDIPATLETRFDSQGNSAGCGWHFGQNWTRENPEQYDFFYKMIMSCRSFWTWVSDFPAGEITHKNLLHLWDAIARKMEQQ